MTEPKTALREVREALKRSNRYIRCIGGGDTAESVLTYKCNERALARLDAVLAQAETYSIHMEMNGYVALGPADRGENLAMLLRFPEPIDDASGPPVAEEDRSERSDDDGAH